MIGFYKEVTGSAEEGRTMDAVYLDSGKAFDIVSNNILTEKHTNYRLDK